MKKSVLFAVLIASATAAMAAKTSYWPVEETFTAIYPYPYPSEETVYPVFPESYPVYPQDGAYPEAKPFEPIAYPFPAS